MNVNGRDDLPNFVHQFAKSEAVRPKCSGETQIRSAGPLKKTVTSQLVFKNGELMRSGRNPTRRNRNIGTAQSGYGQDNRLTIPSRGLGVRYYTSLTEATVVQRIFGGRSLTLVVEKTRDDTCHACTPDDLGQVLSNLPAEDVAGIDFFLLRQPKRKEEVLSPVWGRFAYFAELPSLNLEGRAVILDALPPGIPIRWKKNLGPQGTLELERLREDGHAIRTTTRHHIIEPTLDSIRNTQLYRTAIHEIGHFVDWRNSWTDEEAETAFDTKTSHDKEAFAHAYAERMSERLKRFGVIPFECLLDPDRLREYGLDPADFTPPPRQ